MARFKDEDFIAALERRSWPTGDIAAAVGCSNTTALRHLARLTAAGKACRGPNREGREGYIVYTWRLP